MSSTKRPWDGLLSDAELEVRRRGGYGAHAGIGANPAVLIIDVVRAFTGDEGDDHVTSITKYRQSCGPYAWRAMPQIRGLIAAGRAKGFPIIYTRAMTLPSGLRTAQMRKNARAGREDPDTLARGSQFPPEIAPQPGDILVEKTKPSAFFGSPLLSYLQTLRVDHLIACGCTTSGCVRATVYDAFSNNYGVTLVEDATFDRFETSHRINLFDMDNKFADVRPLAEVLDALGLAAAETREAVAR